MYKSKSIKIVLIILFVIIIYAIAFALIEGKAKDQQFKTFEVVTGLSGLLLSAVGAIYVYNAYEAQREQIKLQKEEIERNRIDVEFNRVVDILYRQLEVSGKYIINKYYSRLKKEFYDPEYPFRDNSFHFDFFEQEYDKVLHYVLNASHAFETLELILTQNNLTDEQHIYLEQILLTHIGREYFSVLDKISEADRDYEAQLKSVSKVIDHRILLFYWKIERLLEQDSSSES